jgi:hypothetical protein
LVAWHRRANELLHYAALASCEEKSWTVTPLTIDHRMMKRRSSASTERLLAVLPAAQNPVAKASIAGPEAKTYTTLAVELGLHIGTVHRHLGRIRSRRPEMYSALMVVHRRQLGRHQKRALALAREHNAWWFQQPGYLQDACDRHSGSLPHERKVAVPQIENQSDTTELGAFPSRVAPTVPSTLLNDIGDKAGSIYELTSRTPVTMSSGSSI